MIGWFEFRRLIKVVIITEVSYSVSCKTVSVLLWLPCAALCEVLNGVLDCQVQKYCTMVLSAMMAGMDDKEDTDDVITIEAMSGLSKILAEVSESDIQAILINVALRIRPCFEKVRRRIKYTCIVSASYIISNTVILYCIKYSWFVSNTTVLYYIV